VNVFVDDCRREWKRLDVPDSVAEEMAAELEADLVEAEAEGVSAEAVLGSGAGDPRAFASAWAAERGVIKRPPNGRGFARRAGVIVAIGVFALIAVLGGALVVVASPSSPTRLAFAPGAISPDGRSIAILAPPADQMPAPPPADVQVHVALAEREAARLWISPVGTLPPVIRIVAVDVDDSGVDTRALGWVLLAVGLGGVVPLTVLWWAGDGRRRVSF
jgi:hypothetical protein